MSLTYPNKPLKFDDGRTKQAFKDDADINKILYRAQKQGTLSHLQKYETSYGDFADFDFETAQDRLLAGRAVFSDLPSEIRAEFNNNPAKFFEFVNDPANADRLPEVLPDLAKPGRQNIDVSSRTPPDDRPEPASAEAQPPASPNAETPTDGT